MDQLSPIPTPRGLPVVGNGLQVPVEGTNRFFNDLAAQHPDGIFGLNIVGRDVALVYDPDMVAELSDETRFHKPIDPPLAHVRDFAGDGLFTARDGETSWGQAHRILLPAFSQRSMKTYFPQMLQVAQELVTAWEREPGRDLNVTDDMTRLTLDTIALSGFDYAFHSFDQPELHPFLQAMGRALTEAMNRTRQLPFVTGLKKRQDAAYRADITAMQELVDEVIRQRRAGGDTGSRDLLGLMLDASDPVTGERLSDENIRNQVLTFLIAGHETTSGTLSFAIYQLLRHPHVLAQAYAEVDRLLPGDTVPTYDTIMKLDVIPRILDETLRLLSPIPAFGLSPYNDEVIGGKYALKAGQKVGILLKPLHTHPAAWGDNAEDFDIDRWLPAQKAQHHPHAYKPFGNGERACIGRQFALTEARLALALVLQKFAIADPHSYRLQIKQTLTIKPDDFQIRVRPRLAHERATVSTPVETGSPRAATADIRAVGVQLTVGYGSNLGASEELAERIADRAGQAGFDVTLSTLDELAAAMPTSGLLVVVTSSYNGKAPDNAQRFDGIDLPRLDGLRYALLGNGNTQWATYQAFPKRVEAALDAAGATPVVARGETDAAGDFDGMADAWLDTLWAALAAEYGTSADAPDTGERWTVEVLDESQVRPAVVSEQAYPITVLGADELVGDPTGLWDFSREAPRPGAKSITVQLPAGVEYATGNHLAVFAKNEPELVSWALTRLRLPRDRVIRLSQDGDRRTHLPVGVPVTAELLLTEFVELQEVATRAQIATLTGFTDCPWTTRQLGTWSDEQTYADEILAKRVSVLALLERFPAIELPLGVFLEMAGPIRPRFYSISSSPTVEPGRPRITVGLVEGDSWSGSGQYRGMCSQYLARLRPGDVFYGYVRVPSPPFEPPASPETPMVLIGPGTGFAPLRGFLQERAATGGGPVKLFYGCRHPEHDWLYRAEVEQWERDGVCEVHTAFSAVPEHPYRFVQQAVAADGDGIWALLEQGAHVYVCGDGARMAPAVRTALGDIYHRHTGGDPVAWLAQLEEDGRYQQDVFA
jgi:cytochrome P450/NADPH-cytochrome P450 reductase